MHIMITLPIFKQAQFYAERFTLGLRRGASPLVLGIAEGDVPQIAVFLAVFVAAKDVNSGVPVRVDDHKTFILLFGRFGRTGGIFLKIFFQPKPSAHHAWLGGIEFFTN